MISEHYCPSQDTLQPPPCPTLPPPIRISAPAHPPATTYWPCILHSLNKVGSTTHVIKDTLMINARSGIALLEFVFERIRNAAYVAPKKIQDKSRILEDMDFRLVSGNSKTMLIFTDGPLGCLFLAHIPIISLSLLLCLPFILSQRREKRLKRGFVR